MNENCNKKIKKICEQTYKANNSKKDLKIFWSCDKNISKYISHPVGDEQAQVKYFHIPYQNSKIWSFVFEVKKVVLSKSFDPQK